MHPAPGAGAAEELEGAYALADRVKLLEECDDEEEDDVDTDCHSVESIHPSSPS